MRKRRVSRITSAIEKDDVTLSTITGNLHNILDFLQSKYYPIQLDDVCVFRKEKAGHEYFPLGWMDFLETSINEKQLKAVVSKGDCNKAPGRDGMCLVFFKVN
jgi:hypothetical protein